MTTFTAQFANMVKNWNLDINDVKLVKKLTSFHEVELSIYQRNDTQQYVYIESENSFMEDHFFKWKYITEDEKNKLIANDTNESLDFKSHKECDNSTNIAALTNELNNIDIKLIIDRERMNELKKNIALYESKKTSIIKQIKLLQEMNIETMFASVNHISDFLLLEKEELIAIRDGIDKIDYRPYGNFPRWIDLKKLVENVIKFKKQYPNHILQQIVKTGQYDTLPPISFYKYTYKTTDGNLVIHSATDRINLDYKCIT